MRVISGRALLVFAITTALADGVIAQTVRVPGTHVVLVPPSGFSAARQYPGFERPEVKASIMVTELPVAATEMMRSMTGPALASKGMTVISAQDVAIKQNPARLLHVRQQTARGEISKWMLIAGDARATIMVVGTFDEDLSPGIGEEIRQSLLSASWGPAAPASPFEGLTFRVTPTARMKLAKRVSNMLMFTESGTTGTPGSSEALYIAGQSIGQGAIGDVETFSEARAKQTTLIAGLTNVTGQHLQIAGADAYQLEADASDARTGRAMRLYQVIVPDDTGYFILQGLVRADRAREILPDFKALTASFRKIEP